MASKARTAGHRDRGAWARRHNYALVALARSVWHQDCTLDSAYAQICEIAAETLEVERVNVWRVNEARNELRCIHAYVRSIDRHNPPGFEEVLSFASEYGSQLDEVRVIDAADVDSDDVVTASRTAMDDYLERHGIRSLLDAPVRSEGELIGVVCHEHVGSARAWTPEDQAFAGSIGDYIAMAYEICRRREAEARLRHLERHDPHTDLPNREHMLEVAHSALRPLQNGAAGLTAIHLQLDAPTRNGHADPSRYGEVLVAVAHQLRKALGETATLARVRDDAFALLPHRQLHETEALDLAERCIDLAQASAVEAGAQHAVVSVGIAFARDLAAPSAETLLRNAELASQRARRNGFNRCEVFDADHHRGLLVRMRTEQALRDAFATQRLLVHYQPEIDLQDGHWRAAEALLRWHNEEDRIIPACDFIDVAEASGFIVPLGRWVLLQACQAARTWPQSDGIAPLLRVNVSARQFEQAGLVDDVRDALTDAGLPPSRLCIELTETVLLRDPPTAVETLARLRALGIGVALDDFGTGYSSLGYLKRLPIDAIKLDRSFISGLPDDRYDLAIVQAMAGLARQTGMDIVAEGVETERQAQCLRECGVPAAQGFLFAPALSNDMLLQQFGARA